MGEVAMVETVKRILAIFLIGMLSACAALNRGAGDIRTIDHAVAHVSTVPAIKSEAVQLFVRGKILASASATPRPVVLADGTWRRLASRGITAMVDERHV
jgi:hypothetical protein